MTLSSIPLGNLSIPTSASSSSSPSSATASFICPDRSFVTRLDFQIVYHVTRLDPNNPEGPYVAGINLFCSGIPTASPVRMQRSPEWPDSIVMPVYGEGWLDGITNLVVYYDTQAVNRVAYGSVTAGRAKGTKWTQVGSQVQGCPLKGVKLKYQEWAQAAQFFFDCPDISESRSSSPISRSSSSTTQAAVAPIRTPLHPPWTPNPELDVSNAVKPIRATTPVSLNDPLATGLYLVLAFLLILLAFLSVMLVRWPIQARVTQKTVKQGAEMRRKRQRQQPRGYELVDPAQFVVIPVEQYGLRSDALEERDKEDNVALEDRLYLPTSSHLHA